MAAAAAAAAAAASFKIFTIKTHPTIRTHTRTHLPPTLPWPTARLSGRRSTVLRAVEPEEEKWGKAAAAELEAAAEVVAVAEDATEIGALKKKLMETLSGTDRGLKATSETRAQIVELITQLEAENPTAAPTKTLNLLDGKWILVYTSFSQLFPLLGSGLPQLVKVDEISQTIDSEELTVQNSVKFAGPLATTSVTTNANYEVRSPKRVQIKIKEGIIGTPQLTDSIEIPEKVEILGQSIDLTPLKGVITSIENSYSSVAKTISGQPPLKIPISEDTAESWLLTTYLDEELRISRGDGGSVFVLVKEGSSLLSQ